MALKFYIGATPKSKSKTLVQKARVKKQPQEKVVYAGRDVTRFYKKGGAKLFGAGEENPKLGKNKRISYVMYLAPAKFGKIKGPNGMLVNTCKDASPECIATCLNEAGNPAFFETKFGARIDKTALYFYDKEFFLRKMFEEIMSYASPCPKTEVAIRCNGTSDLPFIEELTERGYLKQIPKNVIFYDYTKDPFRAGFWKLPSGHDYVVTFSRSELNNPTALKMLERGTLVAVVFRKRLPQKWFGFDVLNADKADDLMIDIMQGEYVEVDPVCKEPTGNVYRRKQTGYVLGLAAKGKLGKFQSKKGAKGFVIDCDNFENCKIG